MRLYNSASMPTQANTNPSDSVSGEVATSTNSAVAGDSQNIDKSLSSSGGSVDFPATLTEGCSMQMQFVPHSKLVAPGEQIVYDVTIRNNGTEACQNVSLSVYYDENESVVSAVPPAAITPAVPSLPLKQLAGVEDFATDKIAGCEIVTRLCFIQLWLSVI